MLSRTIAVGRTVGTRDDALDDLDQCAVAYLSARLAGDAPNAAVWVGAVWAAAGKVHEMGRKP